jgi:hypothetical protein
MLLSEKLKRYRIDRPDEWTMDEFARQAEALEAFIRDHFRSHQECEDSYYSCPKAKGYSGGWGDDPDANPCECGYDEAMELLK